MFESFLSPRSRLCSWEILESSISLIHDLEDVVMVITTFVCRVKGSINLWGQWEICKGQQHEFRMSSLSCIYCAGQTCFLPLLLKLPFFLCWRPWCHLSSTRIISEVISGPALIPQSKHAVPQQPSDVRGANTLTTGPASIAGNTWPSRGAWAHRA